MTPGADDAIPTSAATGPQLRRPGPEISLGEAIRVWAKIGLMSFGGPAGQIALMHRILVEDKRWIDESRFLHALNFCMLLPGPEAQQLATYAGWLLHRMRGGLIAGTLFILPGFAVILALSFLYAMAGTIPAVVGIFVGLKSAVIVIVIQAVIRIAGRSLRAPGAMLLATAAFVSMFVWKVPFPYVILAAAIVGALGPYVSRRYASFEAVASDRDADDAGMEQGGAGHVLRCLALFGALWLLPTVLLAALLGPDDVFTHIGMFFSKMAVVTFGGAYAVLAYVSQEAVLSYHWLAPGEMIDGLAMAETTPGPLIMVTQFVGFMAAYRNPGALPAGLAAVLGAALTVWVTFVPCFLWIFAGAPYVERLRRSHVLSSALAGVTAAVVGVVVNLALWFSIHALFGNVSVVEFAGATLELPVPASLRISPLLIAVVAAVLVVRLRASVMSTLAVTAMLGLTSSLL